MVIWLLVHGEGGGQTGIALHDNDLHDIHVILIRGGVSRLHYYRKYVHCLLTSMVNGSSMAMFTIQENVQGPVVGDYHKQYSQQ